MSKSNPISIYEKGNRFVNIQLIYDEYNEYLKILVITMILNKELRPKAKDTLNELNLVEINIKNPENDIIVKGLKEKFAFLYKQIEEIANQNSTVPQNSQSNINNIQNQPNNNNQFVNMGNPQQSQWPIQRAISNQINVNPNIQGSFQNIPQQIRMSISDGQILEVNNSIKSLLCVLKCLYFCFQGSLDYFINMLKNSYLSQSYSLFILNGIKYLEQEYDVNSLNNAVLDFKNKLGNKINILSGFSSPRPNEIYKEIISLLIDETKNFNFNINNNNFNCYPNLNLNLNNFPLVNTTINNFINLKRNPFFNLFYYLTIDILKCPQCSHILNVNAYQNNELQIIGAYSGNLSYLVLASFKMAFTNFNTCNQCGINCKSERGIYLLTLPQFFIVSFVNKEMAVKNVDFNLDLSAYLYPGIQMNSLYDLFAFIHKINGEYRAVIYCLDGWYSYDNKSLIKINNIVVNQIYPYFVIYKLRN